jgi:hypothetical protein
MLRTWTTTPSSEIKQNKTRLEIESMVERGNRRTEVPESEMEVMEGKVEAALR